LGNTTYTIVATDANGCSLSTTVFVAQPAALGFTQATATDIVCNGQGNGTVTTVATGGTGALSYNLQPTNQTNATGAYTGLQAATYTVTVTDANNCTLTTTLTVAEPAALSITSLAVTDVICNAQGNGTLTASAIGGVGTLSYTLQPLNQTNTTGTFAGLGGNAYTLTVTDANNCTLDSTATIIDPLPVTFSTASVTNVLCFGDSNGTITTLVSGGTGTVYTYSLQPMIQSNTTGAFTGLPVGIYTVTAADQNACTASTTLQITEPAPLSGTLTGKTDVNCHNGSDGSLSVSAAGGTQPFTFTLQPGGTSNATGAFTGLPGGSYTVTITDSNGCSTQVTGIQIVNPAALVYTSVTHEDVTCYGASTGSITVTAAGGVGTITFGLKPITGLQPLPGSYTTLPAGNYTVTATDANNCTLSTTVTILQNPQIKIDSIVSKEPTCWGDGNGALNIMASGGVGLLTYQLNTGNPQSNGMFYNLTAGVYLIRITDSAGCFQDSLYTLNQPEPVALLEFKQYDISCPGGSDGKILVKGKGGHGYYRYYLHPGLYISSSGIFDGLHQGLFTLTIKDTFGCTFDTIIRVLPPVDPFRVTTSKQDLSCLGRGNEGWAEVAVVGGEPPYTYLWSSIPAQWTPRADSLYFGYYFVEVLDSRGCKARDTVYIEPGPCCEEIFIPNAFSPNNDGTNDLFRVTTAAGGELIQFDVFNRWGKRVWSTNDFRSGWDGTYLGESQPMETYFYVFRYKCLTDGQNYVRRGDVQLLR
jgi:gliding motility-associated-like protein